MRGDGGECLPAAAQVAVDVLLLMESNVHQGVPDAFAAAVGTVYGPRLHEASSAAGSRASDAALTLGVPAESINMQAVATASEAAVRSVTGQLFELFAGSSFVAAALLDRVAIAERVTRAEVLASMMEGT